MKAFYLVKFTCNRKEIARIIPSNGVELGKFLARGKYDLVHISAHWRQMDPNKPQFGFDGHETQYWLPAGTAHKYHCSKSACFFRHVPELITVEEVTFINGYMHFLDENRKAI